MIEVTIMQHLESKLDVPVFMEKPEPLLLEYVLFEKTGGGGANKIGTATFAFQSYSQSLYKAALLNEQVKLAVESLTEQNEVSGVRLNSDYNFTDTTTKEYRYQAVFDINHY
ncbi:hypothetical protein [Jeotgalibaca porci]|uniref:hypothetical protein n=1 Tax=Jeotgalibaca porci TaxID=1868793 RepID=UPI0035A00D0A